MFATSASHRPSSTNPHALPTPKIPLNKAIFDAARGGAWTQVHQLLADHPGTFEGQMRWEIP